MVELGLGDAASCLDHGVLGAGLRGERMRRVQPPGSCRMKAVGVMVAG